jgi:chitodextrinase
MSVTASSELFDPATARWTATGSLGTARSGHTASLLDGTPCRAPMPPAWCGKVLVAGGRALDGRPTAAAELYDPATGTWRPVGALGTARSLHTATVLSDGRVLVAGGEVTDGNATTTAELYDPGAEAWAATDSLDVSRYDHGATLLPSGRVLVVGGRETVVDPASEVTVQQPTRSAEIYHPADGVWRSAGSLFGERSDHSVDLLADGRVAAVGGVDSELAMRRSVELYDPAAPAGAEWTPASSMGVRHSDHTATVLLGGRLLVAGGGNGRAPDTDLAEVYDPGADAWTFSGPLRAPRRQHTATLLDEPGCAPNCGKVLVAGGAQGLSFESAVLASAELFDPAADTAPAAITNLTATSSSASRATLTFSAPGATAGAPPAASRYVIKQSTAPISDEGSFDRARALCGGVCRFAPAQVGERITFRVEDLTPETTYHYVVKAQDEAGALGPLSNAVRATTSTVAPGAVTGLSGKAISARAVALGFAAAGSNGAAGPVAGEYVIKQSRRPIEDEAAFDAARSLCAGVCRFSPTGLGAQIRLRVTDLEPRTTYYYAVRARDAAGNVGPRSTARARTRPDSVAPGRVRGLKIRVLSGGKLRLSFRAPGSDRGRPPPPRRYVVKQSRRPISSSRRFRRAQSLCRRGCRFSPRQVGDVLTLTVTGLRSGRRYHYAVRARDAAGNTGPRSRSQAASTRSASKRGRRGRPRREDDR